MCNFSANTRLQLEPDVQYHLQFCYRYLDAARAACTIYNFFAVTKIQLEPRVLFIFAFLFTNGSSSQGFLFMAQQPLVGQGVLTFKRSRALKDVCFCCTIIFFKNIFVVIIYVKCLLSSGLIDFDPFRQLESVAQKLSFMTFRRCSVFPASRCM